MEIKNVFLCIPTLRNAGAERFVTELACSINKEEFHVIIVVTGIFENNTAFYRKLKKEGIDVIDATTKNYCEQILLLIKLLKQYKPVIIHSNVSSVLHVLLPIIISNVKTKHLFTTHSMGYRLFYGLKKKLLKICFHKGFIVPVAICDTVKKSIEEAYALPVSKVECVNNGVDVNSFTKKTMLKEKYFTFICVGTLYHIKNQDLLIEAFKIVREKYDFARLILVGDGELKEILKNKVKNYGLDDSVEFVGNQTDIVGLLSSADVYCCSSKVEGLPISVLEAMACSLPVITTAAGGVVDIVKDGVNGFIVESDPVEYSKKMVELIQNNHLRNVMSISSREVSKEYSLEKCVKRYEDLYKKYSI